MHRNENRLRSCDGGIVAIGRRQRRRADARSGNVVARPAAALPGRPATTGRAPGSALTDRRGGGDRHRGGIPALHAGSSLQRGLSRLGGGSSARPDHRHHHEHQDARLRPDRGADRDARGLLREPGLGPQPQAADHRRGHRPPARDSPAEPAAAAHRHVQLPRLRPARLTARPQSVHARDRRRISRSGLPDEHVAPPEQPVRTAVHSRHLSASARDRWP